MSTFVSRFLFFCAAVITCTLPVTAAAGSPIVADRQLRGSIPPSSVSILTRSVPPEYQKIVDGVISQMLQVREIPGLAGRGQADGIGSRYVAGLTASPTTILYETWDVDSTAWSYTQKADFTYDEFDRMVNSIDSYWNGSGWDPETRYTDTYDGAGNMTTELIEGWSGSGWDPLARISYTYNGGGGEILTSLLEIWNGSGWDPFFRLTRSIDGSGNPTETVTEIFIGIWMNNNRFVFTYDGSNRMTGVLQQNWAGSAWANFQNVTLAYDGNDRVTNEVVQEWNGSAWDNLSRYSSTYDGSGHVTEYLTESWAGIWIMVNREVTTYDGAGHPTEFRSQNWNGSGWDDDIRTNNTFNGGGDLTQSVHQVWNGTEWVNQNRETYTYGVTTAVEERNRNAAGYRLTENYPNPFNPSTEIGYSIRNGGTVRLTVHDMLGREVAVLVNEALPAGSYSARWDADNLPGGVYFYRLEADGFRETKKMILVK